MLWLISLFGVKLSIKKKLVFSFPVVNVPNVVCETCEIGKKHKNSFPTRKFWRARKLLEIVHSNLC